MSPRTLLFVLLGLAAVAGSSLSCRETSPRATHSQKLVVIGFDGLDPDLVRQWASEGKLPTFARLIDQGTLAELDEWRQFVTAVGVTDIVTRAAHPQSNGVIERLHRTHRAEGLDDEALVDYYHALDAMAGWSDFYNHQRPHSALGYLRPMD